MLDRQQIETILSRRFPGATLSEIAAATNAIMGMGDDWEEVPRHQFDAALRALDAGDDVRLFRRRGRCQ